MNSFISWVGGKMALRDEIIARFPLEYGRYIEVFGGAGWVLFRKRSEKFEVWNDFNSDLVNLYLSVKGHSEELIHALDWTLNSRTDFNRLKTLFRTPVKLPDVPRAADYFRLINLSYGSKCDNFGGQPCEIGRRYPAIRGAHVRLGGVVIENKDFEALLRQYDREDAFSYLDPPYFGTEDYYSGVSFTPADHARLQNALAGLKGKFLLSYNDCPEIRELYRDFNIEAIARLSNLSQRFEGGAEYPELFISNYDTSEKWYSVKVVYGLSSHFYCAVSVCGTSDGLKPNKSATLRKKGERNGNIVYSRRRLLSAEYYAVRPKGRTANRAVRTYAAGVSQGTPSH